MGQFQPPAGYQLDANTGLYYMQAEGKDATGKPALLTNWFNTKTGQFTQTASPLKPAPKRIGARIAMMIAGVLTACVLLAVINLLYNYGYLDRFLPERESDSRRSERSRDSDRDRSEDDADDDNADDESGSSDTDTDDSSTPVSQETLQGDPGSSDTPAATTASGGQSGSSGTTQSGGNSGSVTAAGGNASGSTHSGGSSSSGTQGSGSGNTASSGSGSSQPASGGTSQSIYDTSYVFGRFVCSSDQFEPPVLILYENLTFELTLNFSEGMNTYYGSYTVSSKESEMDDVYIDLTIDHPNNGIPSTATVCFSDSSDYCIFLTEGFGLMGYEGAPYYFWRE